jgi:chaperonin cofactor prefoldin
MKKKKDLDEEISRLENEIKVAGSQKTGHSKRMESYRKYILTE